MEARSEHTGYRVNGGLPKGIWRIERFWPL